MKKELQSKDLRIGNFVNCKFATVPVKVLELTTYDVKLNNGFAEYKQLQPIQLTEEMCDRLGCYYGMGGEPRFLANDLSISVHFKNECVIIELGDGIIFIDYIEYVHELQNLYFALTGEELELKDETKP